MRITEIAEIVGGNLQSFISDDKIEQLSIDSRTSRGGENELFFAFQGAHKNGLAFIPNLVQKGTRNFIVEDTSFSFDLANVITVPSAPDALQKLAKYKREEFRGEVIGITGSNGKTIVKEWLSELLSQKFNTHKSPGSFNSQIGVPLSLWPLSNHHDLAIIEAGISLPQEMTRLSDMIRPTMGIFTNIGNPHSENFESQEQKILEKLKLFSNCPKLIVCLDHKNLFDVISKKYNHKLVSWSSKESADYNYKLESNLLTVSSSSLSIRLPININDDASVENLMHAVVCALELGIPEDKLTRAVSGLRNPKMRFEVKAANQDNYIIDDSYSNDFEGLVNALNFMDKQPLAKERTVILSDFQQQRNTSRLIEKLNKLLLDKDVNHVITIGHQFNSSSFDNGLRHLNFPTTETLLDSLHLESLKNQLILIKGAREFKFELISKKLSQKAHGTRLEINLDAVVHNLNYYRSQISSNTKLMVMVKAMTYGSSNFELAKLLQFHNVDYLSVAYTDEGVDLRKNEISLPIMVMNPKPEDAALLLEHRLEPEIFSLFQLQEINEFFKFHNEVLNIHIILNTGMNRLGFIEKEIEELNEYLAENPKIKIKSVFSHLAAADDANEIEFTKKQVEKFSLLSKKLSYSKGDEPLFHILNSAGIASFPQFQMDMVRLGIGLHGLDPSAKLTQHLIPTSTLKTTISQILEIPKGESIGYGRKGVSESDTRIATIAIGYADGYLRKFGNGGASVCIHGKLYPTIGNICMDMTMVEIGYDEVKVGDEVILFGENPTISDLAAWSETIPYEVLTNVSSRVQRVFFAE